MDVSGLIDLMDSKKRCLRRYLDLSEGFLSSAEGGDLSGLQALEQGREAIIKALGMYDRKITSVATGIPGEQRTPALAEAVQSLLDAEAVLIHRILKADDRIMACIEREKARLKQEMIQNQKSKDIAGRFKSGWVPEAGEGLDQKV